jgi:hypothetical protein
MSDAKILQFPVRTLGRATAKPIEHAGPPREIVTEHHERYAQNGWQPVQYVIEERFL